MDFSRKALVVVCLVVGIGVAVVGVAAWNDAQSAKDIAFGEYDGGQASSDYQEPVLLKTEKLTIWPEAASVRLFVEDIPYDKPNRPDHGMSKPAGVVLTKARQAIVSNAVQRKTYAEYPVVSACFIPHHFFRFYDARGRQLGELQVCYCCGGIELSGTPHRLADRQMWGFDYDGVEKMMADMGISSQVQCTPE
jgi:hypothetical protein